MKVITPAQIRARLTSPLGARELGLDVVRGVAIILAVGWHFAGQPSGNPVSGVLLAPIRAFGWAGVDLFFVLSGFLVGRIIFGEHARTGRFNGGRFLARRAFKLWPVYYLFLAYLVVTNRHNNPWRFLPEFVHVQNYAQAPPPHLWSLAVEEHFYLVLALLLPLAFRRGVKPRTIAWVTGAVMAVTLAERIIAWHERTLPVVLQQLTHFRVDSLLAGVLLAMFSIYRPGVFARVADRKWLWLAGTAVGVCWLSLVPKWTGLGATVGYTAAYLAAASFMLLLYRAAWVVRLRAVLRPVGVLGIYSYAIYLTHVTTAEYVTHAVLVFAPWVNRTPLRIVVLYAGAVAVAVVLTRLVEWPALKLRDRILPARARAIEMVPPEDTTLPEVGEAQSAGLVALPAEVALDAEVC